MRSNSYYWEHEQRIREQRLALHAPLGALTAGQKKDLVFTNRLWGKAGRVAIYGWHQHAGAPIQPLSTVHGARYADYSHGVRLVSAVAFVNGRARSILESSCTVARRDRQRRRADHRVASLITSVPSPLEQVGHENACTITVAC
jgi:hypothetical protein